MSIFSRIAGAPIRVYQRTISANTQPRCRYSPSCSHYALEALEIHGVFKGTLLSTWRVLRCNPWSAGGVDRVPAKGSWPTAPLGHAELLALYEQEDSSPCAHREDTIREKAQ